MPGLNRATAAGLIRAAGFCYKTPLPVGSTKEASMGKNSRSKVRTHRIAQAKKQARDAKKRQPQAGKKG